MFHTTEVHSMHNLSCRQDACAIWAIWEPRGPEHSHHPAPHDRDVAGRLPRDGTCVSTIH